MSWLGPIELLFLFAPFVVVPLALRLLDRAGETRDLRRVQLAAAGFVVAAFLLPRGPWAAGAATGWMLFTLAVGWLGFRRLLHAVTVTDLAGALACLFLPVGGGWFVLSRSGPAEPRRPRTNVRQRLRIRVAGPPRST